MTEEPDKTEETETTEPAEVAEAAETATSAPDAEAAPETEAASEAAPAEETPAAEAAPAEEKPKRTRSRAKKPAEAAAPAAEEKPKRTRARRKPEETAPALPRARRRRDELPAVTVRAHAKYVRTSARKARLVCDHIRGKSVPEARAILAMTPRAAAIPWTKLLESAVANAENNHELVGEELRVERAFADEGPTLKRFRPRAMGRATRIRKRTSHLTILLAPKE